MRILRIVAAVLMTLTVAACSNRNHYDEEQIRANAQGYLQAVGDYHFDDAIPYASRHTREYTIPVFNRLMQNADTDYVNSNRPSVFTYYKVRRVDDTSACIYYHKHTPIKDIDDSLRLIYEDGQWLADVHLGVIPYFNMSGHGEDTMSRPLPRILLNPVRHNVTDGHLPNQNK